MAGSETDFFKPFRNYTALLSISIVLIFAVLYVYLWFNFDLVKNFFSFFELTPDVKSFSGMKLENLISKITLTDIIIIFAGFFGLFYLLWIIENKGFLAFEGYDIYQKHFQTAFYILSLFNFVLLIPIIVYLLREGDRNLEAIFIVTLYLISLGMARWLRKFLDLIKNYDELLAFSESLKNPLDIFNVFSDGKAALKLAVGMRTFFSRSLLLLMFLTFFYSIELNFNLLTILYIVLIFLVWYFIICSVTKIPLASVDIYFNSEQIFNRVFIIEESSHEYLVTLHLGNVQKKSNEKFN
jgi:hypothetical protein